MDRLISADPSAEYIQIEKGTPMLQYIAATLPDVSLSEHEMDSGLVLLFDIWL